MASIQRLYAENRYQPLSQLAVLPAQAMRSPQVRQRSSSPELQLTSRLTLSPTAKTSRKNLVPILSQPLFSQPQLTSPKPVLSPPDKNAPPTAEGAKALRAWLEAEQVGGAQAAHTYSYYEAIEQYLGPFGEKGYPLGYGKHYNQKFMNNQTLMAEPTTRRWVEKTGLLLQKAITDYLVARYQAGTLGKLTETELRKFAFSSHPQAYTEAGLADVVLHSPELLPSIVAVPSAEFFPGSGNTLASWKQVGQTSLLVSGDILEHAADTVVETVSDTLHVMAHSTVYVVGDIRPAYALGSAAGRSLGH